MKTSRIVQALHHIKKAKEFFEDFIREYPNSMGSLVLKRLIKFCDKIYFDLVSTPMLGEETIQAIREEWQSDAFTIDAITEKVALLSPEQRESLESVIDAVLNGEKITIEFINS